MSTLFSFSLCSYIAPLDLFFLSGNISPKSSDLMIREERQFFPASSVREILRKSSKLSWHVLTTTAKMSHDHTGSCAILGHQRVGLLWLTTLDKAHGVRWVEQSCRGWKGCRGAKATMTRGVRSREPRPTPEKQTHNLITIQVLEDVQSWFWIL